MWFWSFLWNLFDGNLLLTVMGLALLILTVLSAVVGYFIKSTGLYAAFSLLFVCACGVVLLVCGVGTERLALLLAIEGGLVGIGYAVVYTCLECARKFALRKAERAEIRRKVKFTLPDRDNQYLQDRLRTHLRLEGGESVVEKEGAGLRLGYAHMMLCKIREASLTAVERMEIEEMASLLVAYENKVKWSNSDLQSMTEIFSRLLKLSAKYDVAV